MDYWRIARWGVAVLLLAMPAVAMQFTKEVNWGPGDFIVFGAMLFTVCAAFDLATGRTGNRAYLAATAIAVVTAFVMIWANLAVGIIGSESHPANLMFVCVLVVGVVSALVGGTKPLGMARAMSAVALAMAMAVLVVIGLQLGSTLEVVMVTVFTLPWPVCAWLFRRAAEDEIIAAATVQSENV